MAKICLANPEKSSKWSKNYKNIQNPFFCVLFCCPTMREKSMCKFFVGNNFFLFFLKKCESRTRNRDAEGQVFSPLYASTARRDCARRRLGSIEARKRFLCSLLRKKSVIILKIFDFFQPKLAVIFIEKNFVAFLLTEILCRKKLKNGILLKKSSIFANNYDLSYFCLSIAIFTKNDKKYVNLYFYASFPCKMLKFQYFYIF